VQGGGTVAFVIVSDGNWHWDGRSQLIIIV
jgi:hypothetical protein